ncbi:unnamed protein product [Peronospora effusa]|nr:unnamed protein product [Peronospora effusa]
MPVMFTSRTLKSNEVNYSTVEKEVLALLRILETCFTMLVTRPLKVLTRHSTLAWLVKSSGLQGRWENWAALLSQWTLEILKCKKGEDQVLGALAASITPRENVDSILSSIAPKKQSRQVVDLPTPTVELNEELYVMSFDGSARVKQGGGACSAIVWRLPAWTIVAAASRYLDKSTVNEAEYEGMLLGFDLLEPMERRRLIICGDYNLVIRQMRGEIECKASGLSPLRAKALSQIYPGALFALELRYTTVFDGGPKYVLFTVTLAIAGMVSSLSYPDGALFFAILIDMGRGWQVLIVVVIAMLSSGVSDSIQMGLAAELTTCFPKMSFMQARIICVLLNAPAIAIGYQQYDILTLYLIADLLCTAAVGPMLLGTWKRATRTGSLTGCGAGLATIFICGVIAQGKFIGGFNWFILPEGLYLQNSMITFIVTLIVPPVVTVVVSLLTKSSANEVATDNSYLIQLSPIQESSKA